MGAKLPCLAWASCDKGMTLTTATKTLVCDGATVFTNAVCQAAPATNSVGTVADEEDIMSCASILPFTDDCKAKFPCLSWASCDKGMTLTTATQTLVCDGVTVFTNAVCQAAPAKHSVGTVAKEEDIMSCASILPFTDDCKAKFPCLAWASCDKGMALTTATQTLVCDG